MMMEPMNDIEWASQLGAALHKPNTEHGGTPYCTVPNGFTLQDLEHLLPAPTRKRGKVVTTDSASFILYNLKHGLADETMIYAEIDSEKNVFNLVSVLNDHRIAEPMWRDHRCTFQPKRSVEWVRWLSKNKSPMTQSDFAAWLEDNLPDIASVPGMPSGTDILKMALGFEATADKRMRSKISLQSGGYQLEYVDDEDKDTRTRMQVFERFTLGLPVFDASDSAYPLEARLKYREKEGKLTFWFELIRHDIVFKTAVMDELAKIKKETGFSILAGLPE
jgi:uncharacterized protein YfdQ (DUF2303 family)